MVNWNRLLICKNRGFESHPIHVKKLIIAALIAVLTLTACVPLNGKPVPSKLSEDIVFEVDVQGNTGQVQVQIFMTAWTPNPRVASGRSDGEGYPFSKLVTLPWSHTIFYEPGIVVHAALTVYATMVAGETIVCAVKINGRELNPASMHAKFNGKQSITCSNDI